MRRIRRDRAGECRWRHKGAAGGRFQRLHRGGGSGGSHLLDRWLRGASSDAGREFAWPWRHDSSIATWEMLVKITTHLARSSYAKVGLALQVFELSVSVGAGLVAPHPDRGNPLAVAAVCC